MEIAEEFYLLEPPRPFACSRKWLVGVKARLGIVNGKLAFDDNETQGRSGPSSRSGTPELRNTLPEAPEASPGAPSCRLPEDTGGASDSLTSPASSGLAPAVPHATTGVVRPAIPSASTSALDEGTTNWVQDASSSPMSQFTQTNLSYETLSLQSSPESRMPDWFNMSGLTATKGQHEPFDRVPVSPALDEQFENTYISSMGTSFLLKLTGDLISSLSALPDIQAPCPPLAVNGSTAPAPFAPPNRTGGLTLPSGVLTAHDLPHDPSGPSPSAWSMGASPAFVPSVDPSSPPALPR